MNIVQTGSTSIVRRFLLVCGIVAIPLYAATDILAGTLYRGYSFTDQAVSELFAIGAPTSGVVVPLFTLYSFLVLAFALGVWMSAGERRIRRILALVMIAGAVNGLLLWNFFPMHMRGDELTFTDTMHLILAATGAIIGAVAVGIAALAFGRRFRFYSIGTIVMMFVPTILTFLLAPQVAANENTPWTGLLERTAFAVYWQWQIVLAFILLREEERTKIPSQRLT
jgi:uncharacterized protein DUF998